MLCYMTFENFDALEFVIPNDMCDSLSSIYGMDACAYVYLFVFSMHLRNQSKVMRGGFTLWNLFLAKYCYLLIVI